MEPFSEQQYCVFDERIYHFHDIMYNSIPDVTISQARGSRYLTTVDNGNPTMALQVCRQFNDIILIWRPFILWGVPGSRFTRSAYIDTNSSAIGMTCNLDTQFVKKYLELLRNTNHAGFSAKPIKLNVSNKNLMPDKKFAEICKDVVNTLNTQKRLHQLSTFRNTLGDVNDQ